ncbi:MAG TPA: peptidoglycan DD-metalloendopeptidase family protein [Thiobacillus sp.]|nr:MAG: peptidoglycan-binding protein LysM [Hydrogenophilales bacterium 28-61-11]OYZ55829.1 MAG: peptidoglycan-binding protein LysM [Hydrogenophilales bacterium 16-61-112]HQT31174.1 peptidoglycan DD-metalloendopeptidase family protein [Thiobacillus sp.]HQT71122.1 peptidoglycan DD-metalloendopeptidase family protein [Thiobacillus sp.]
MIRALQGLAGMAFGLMVLGLGGCASSGTAPVSDRTARSASSSKPAAARPNTPQITPSTTGWYTVQRGDTLYAIAFANSLDHRDVARWNRIESPDLILVDQVLRLTPPPGAVEIQPLDDGPRIEARPLAEPSLLRTPQAVLLPYSDANWAQVTRPATVAVKPPVSAVTPSPTPVPATPAAVAAQGSWLWPAEGTLAGRFGAAGGKGIDIVGTRNTPVIATAAGKVVYSGSGLRGYGKLLIVKHAGEFLSAYAHNETILVKEGDSVTAGQRIALMGDSDSARVKLHFEVRRYGKPLDPLDYLPERS